MSKAEGNPKKATATPTHSFAAERPISPTLCTDVIWNAGAPRMAVALLLRSCLSKVAVRRNPLPDIFAGNSKHRSSRDTRGVASGV